MRHIPAALIALGLGASASAQITYADAQATGNTIELNTGSTSAWSSPNNNGGDGLWGLRTTGPGVVANGGDAWQATNAEDAPTLMTTVSGLAPGQPHTVYIYIVGKVCSHWPIQAGLSLNRMRDLDDRDGIGVLPDGTPTSPPSCSDFRFRLFLGHQVADSAGDIRVFIDDYTTADRPNQTSDRVVYDGIGAEPTLRGGVAPFGRGCAGSSGAPPFFFATERPTIGNQNFAMELTGGPAQGPAGTLFGFAAAPVRLGPCLIELAGAVASLQFTLDAGGRGSAGLGIPSDPTLVGVVLYAQTATLDVGGALFGIAAVSRTLDLHFGN